MNRCVLIIPYFGKFNNYFDLFIGSCGYNSDFDWLLITDNDCAGLPSNIHYVHFSFQEIKDRIQSLFGFQITLDNPYKIVDYKPAYGLIFHDYVKDYEFWGHCDTDIIFGDLSNFITKEVFDNYEKILARGHLTIYKNIDKMNKLFMSQDKSLFIDYKYAFTTPYICHFDEFEPWIDVCKHQGVRFWNQIIAADIDCNSYRFKLVKGKNNDAKQIFVFNKGILTRYYFNGDRVDSDEWAYIHLQKRKMDMKITNDDSFFIAPNCFFNKDVKSTVKDILNEYSINKLYLIRRLNRTKEIYNNIKSGALDYRRKKYINNEKQQ